MLRYSISEPLSLEQGFTLVLLASASSETGEQTVVSMQDRHGVEFQLFTRSAQFGVRGSGVQEVMFHDTYMWPRRESTRVDAYVFRASTGEVSMRGFDMRGQYKRQSEVETLDLANATFDSYFTLSFGSESFAGAFAKIYAEPNYESDDSIHGIIHQMFEYSRAHDAQLQAWYPFDGHLQNTVYRDERANVTKPRYRFVSGRPGNLYALDGEFSGKTSIMHPGTLAWNDPWTISAWVRIIRASTFVVTDPRPLYVWYENVPGSILDVQSMHGQEIGEIMIISLSSSSKCDVDYEPPYEATNGKLLVLMSRNSLLCDPCSFIDEALELSPSGVLMLNPTCSEPFTTNIPIVQINTDKEEHEPSFETIYGQDVSLVQVLESKFRTVYPDGEENLQELTRWYEPRPVKFYFHTDRTWGNATIGVCEGCTGARQYNLTRETDPVPIMSVLPVGVEVSATNHHIRVGDEGQFQVPYVSQQWLHVAFVYGLDTKVEFSRSYTIACEESRSAKPCKSVSGTQIAYPEDEITCANDKSCLAYKCYNRHLYFCFTELQTIPFTTQTSHLYYKKSTIIQPFIRYYINGQLQATLPFSNNENLDAMEIHFENCDVDDLRIYDSAIEPQHLPNTGMVCEAGMEGFGGDGQLACVPCSHGKYKPNLGNDDCLSCPQNKTTNHEGATDIDECICAPGYVTEDQSCEIVQANSWARNGTNYSCPEFSSSSPGAQSVEDCICNHGYERAENNTCRACATGKFNSHAGQDCTSCYYTQDNECVLSNYANSTACPGLCSSIPGYQVNAAGDGLEPCPMGTYNGGNGTNCTSCGVGYTSTRTGLTTFDQCTCDVGYTSFGLPLERTSCVPCAANHYKPNKGLQKCKVCAENETSVQGQAECECILGMYQNRTTQKCEACGADTYKNVTGDQKCTTCADNATTNGRTGQRACVCSAGFYDMSDGLCLPCEITKYKTHAGNHSCTACPDPQHTTLALASTLLDDCLCVGGYEPQPDNTTQCQPCNVSFYKNFSGNVQCEPCADNVVTESTGSLACACPRGQYKLVGGHCADCAQDFYKGYISDDFCMECPNNSGTNYSEGAHSCMCNPGYFLDAEGNCTGCGINDFKAHYGNASCNDCPAREITSNQMASTSCECEQGSTKNLGEFPSCICNIGYEVLTANILNDSCTLCATNYGKPTISNNDRCRKCGFAEEVDFTTKACVCKAGRENDTSVSRCTCKPGFEVMPSSQQPCTACKVDHYRDGYEDAQCQACPLHSSTLNTTNNTICTCYHGYIMNNSVCTCVAGYERNDTSDECQPCSVDFYKPGVGEDKCTKCPPRNSTNGTQASVWCNHPGPNVVVDERGNYLCEEGFGVHEFTGPFHSLMCNNAYFNDTASNLRECEEACTLNSDCKGFFWGLETHAGKVTYLGRDGKCALCSSGSLQDDPFTDEHSSNYYKKKIPFELMFDACEPCTDRRRVETPDGVHRICKFCPGNVCECDGQNMTDESGVCECAVGYQPDFFVEIQESSAQCENDIQVDKAKTLQACKHMCHMFTEPYSSDFTDGIAIPGVVQSEPSTYCLTPNNLEIDTNPYYHAWEGNLVKLLQTFTCSYGFAINTGTSAAFCCRGTNRDVGDVGPAYNNQITYYPPAYDPKQHIQPNVMCFTQGIVTDMTTDFVDCEFGYYNTDSRPLEYYCCRQDDTLVHSNQKTYYPPGYPQHAGSETAAVVTEIETNWQCLGLTWKASSQTCTLCGTTPPAYNTNFQTSTAASTVFRFAPEYPPPAACSACPKDTAKPEIGNHLCEACGGEGTTDTEGATSCTCAPGSNRTGPLCFCDGGYEPSLVFEPDDSVPGEDSTTLGYEDTATERTGVQGWRLVRYVKSGSSSAFTDRFGGTQNIGNSFQYSASWSVNFSNPEKPIEYLVGECTLAEGKYTHFDANVQNFRRGQNGQTWYSDTNKLYAASNYVPDIGNFEDKNWVAGQGWAHFGFIDKNNKLVPITVRYYNEFTIYQPKDYIKSYNEYSFNPPGYEEGGLIYTEYNAGVDYCVFVRDATEQGRVTFGREGILSSIGKYFDIQDHELWVAQLQIPRSGKQYARFTTCEPCPVNNFKTSNNEEMCKVCEGDTSTAITGATECVSAAGVQPLDITISGQVNSGSTPTPTSTPTSTGRRRLLQTAEASIAAGLASITGSPLHWITVTHLEGTLYEFVIYAESQDAAASVALLITPESMATEIPGAEIVGTIEVIQLPEPKILLCPADTYKDSISDTPCTSCGFFYTTNGEIGQASPSACVCREEYVQDNMCYCDDGYVFSGTACVPCEADTYRAPDALTCVGCPDFSNSVSAANTIFDCKCNFGLQHNSVGQCVCPLGFEFDQAPPTCVLCEVGYYRESVDDAECLQCPADSWANATGSSARSACLCNVGFTGADGGPCTACVAGKYKNTTGSALCEDCGTGKYSGQVGAETESVCTICPDAASSPAGSTLQEHCRCNLGYTGSDGGPCDPCIPGTYKAEAGSAQCVACAEGKYLEHAAAILQSECVSCVENSHSEPGSANATDCSCNAGYTGSDGGPCVACVAGKYKPSPGSGACLVCEAGKFSGGEAQTNASTCVDCPAFSSAISASTTVHDCHCNAGYTGPHGGPCVACEAGKFKTHNGSALCTECGAGKYSIEIAQVYESGCTTCPDFSHSSQGSNNVTECTCNMGYTGNDGGPCSACVAGTYKPTAGSQPCLLCATGKFSTLQAQILASNCTDCPASSDAPSGSDSITDCVCNAGFTGENGGACTGGVPGTYKEGSGPEECVLCAPGKYSTLHQAISQATCTVCPTHTESAAGSDELTDCVCTPGYTGPDGAVCAACVPGKYKNVPGSSQCTECGTDTYSNLEAANSSAKCLPCPEHSQSAAGSSTLTQCLCNAGYTGPHGGPCVECQAGEYKVHPGSVPCSDCPAGKYSDDIAQTTNATCELCPDHTDSEPGSPALPACKCNEGYTGPDGGDCVACDAGKYKPTQGSASCTECPTYSISPSASDQPEDCRCNAGYTGENGDTCTACGVGSYKPIEGPDLCTACAADTYSPTVAAQSQDTCLACPENTEAPSSSDELADCICVAGFIGNSVDSCTQCPPGTYASETSECIDCEAGKYSPTPGASDASTCVDCLVTKTSSVGSSACVCDAGYFPHVTNPESYCSNCPFAHYKEEAGDHACTPCPENTFSNSATLTSIEQCLPCKDHSISDPGSRQEDCLCVVGYFSNSNICELCPAGTYKDTVENRLGCTTCSPNSYSLAGASTCFQCPVDTTAPAGSTSADACQCADGRFFTPSTYSANNQKTCSLILEGYEWAHCDQALMYEQTCSGVAECLGYSCFFGSTILCEQKADMVNGDEPILIEKTEGGCETCSVNTYVSDTGDECTSCPADAVSAAGSPDITHCKCDLGYTGPDGGTCNACAEGQYKAVVGNAACVNCPSSSSSPEASVAVTDCLCNAGYTGPDGGTCEECGAGTYKDSIGSVACANCPMNTYLENTAALDVSECVACPADSESIAGSISQDMCLCKPGFESVSVYQMYENTQCVRNGAFEEEIGCAGGCWYLTIERWFTPSEPHEYMTKTCNEHPQCAGYYYVSTDSYYFFCYAVTDQNLNNANYADSTLYVKSPPTCQLCESGKYKSTTSNDLCIACASDSHAPAGSTAQADCACNLGYTGPDGGPCSACTTGTYKSTTGSNICSTCPQFSISDAGSVSLQDCQCNAGYSGPDGGPCTACQPDTYSVNIGSTLCTTCPAFSSSPGASVAVDDCVCNAGYTGPDGGACSACVAGTFKSTTGSQACTSCSVGETSLEGATSEDECFCDSGYYLGETTYSSATRDFTCTGYQANLQKPCTLSWVESVFTQSCLPFTDCKAISCVSNYLHICYNIEESASSYDVYLKIPASCTACESGTYKSGTGSAPCTACPASMTSPPTSTSQNDCECNAGFTGPNGGSCTECVSGKYKSGVGSEACASCPAFSTSPTGSTVVESCQCNAGYTGSDGGSCSPCAAGTYKGAIGSDVCTECSAGTYSPTLGLTTADECITCPLNSDSASGSVSIQDCLCSANYYFMDSSYSSYPQHRCRSTAGFAVWTNLESAKEVCSNTEDCEFFNHYSNVMVICKIADIEYNSQYTGYQKIPASCQLCPTGTFSVAGAQSADECLCNAGYGFDTQLSECTQCEVGKYKVNTGNTDCTPCPASSTSLPGSTALTQCTCNAGYTGTNGGTCSACAAGTYKATTGSHACSTCPSLSTSLAGSASLEECICNAGYGANTDSGLVCEQCAAGKYSLDGICVDCPSGATSPVGSTSGSDCACGAGYRTQGVFTTFLDRKFDDAFDSNAQFLSFVNEAGHETITFDRDVFNADPEKYIEMIKDDCLNTAGCKGFQIATSYDFHIRFENQNVIAPFSTIRDITTATVTSGWNVYLNEGAFECQACPENTYLNSASDAECTQCPVFSSSPSASTAITDCQCNSGFTREGDSCLKVCAAGTFYPPFGILSLGRLRKQCYNPTSFTWTNDHQTGYDIALELCNTNPTCVGFYRRGFDSSCTSSLTAYGYWCSSDPIEANSMAYCNDIYSKVDACIECDAGKYSEANAQACTNCPAYSTSSAGSPCTCNAGYTGADGGTCSACPAGKYKAVSGSAACSLCEEGKYQSSTGKTVCVDCDGGGTSPAGSDSSSDCAIVCSAGTHYFSILDACVPCNTGKYQPTSGTQTDCLTCADGTYQDLNAGTVCKDCPDNSYSLISADGALDQVIDCKCNAGYTGPDGGTCTACVAGKYKISTGAAACSNCPANTYQSLTGQTGCLTCGANTQSLAGSDSVDDCLPVCAAGSHYDSSLDQCASCDVGKYQPTSGTQTDCLTCADGTYQDASAQTVCKDCPGNSYSLISADGALDTSADCKCNAGYTGPDGGTCTACVAGKYKTSTGSAACSDCAANTYQSLTGQTGCEACADGTESPAGSDSASDCVEAGPNWCVIEGAYPSGGYMGAVADNHEGWDANPYEDFHCPPSAGWHGFLWFDYGTYRQLFCLKDQYSMVSSAAAVTTYYDSTWC